MSEKAISSSKAAAGQAVVVPKFEKSAVQVKHVFS
jgi:hypothetical protein